MHFVTLLLIAEIVWIATLCVGILLERRSPQATLAWILTLALMPYVGIIVYLLVGPRRLRRKARRYAWARSQVAHTTGRLRKAAPALSRDVPLSPPAGQIAALIDRVDNMPPGRAQRIQWLHDGDACYASLEEAIGAARHHVHLEYYIWDADRTGTRLRDLLCRKAREGVEVRFLVDALGSPLGRTFLRPLREAGAEVAWFNRISLARFRPGLFNFRSHRKIVVCDGQVGFTGGINVCDDESAAVKGRLAWRDTHLRIEGLPVGWLQRTFLEDWFFATGGGPRSDIYFPAAGQEAQGPWVQIATSGPDYDWYAIHKLFFATISAARRRVLISTPYFVPDEPILAAIEGAALRGVDVRLLLPKQNNSFLVAQAARSYFNELLQAGVQVYEYGPRFLHAKTLVADDVALVGTANMDNRSFRLNFEVMAAIYDAPAAEELAQTFAADLRHAERYSGRRARHTPFHQRLVQSAARLLGPVL